MHTLHDYTNLKFCEEVLWRSVAVKVCREVFLINTKKSTESEGFLKKKKNKKKQKKQKKTKKCKKREKKEQK